MLAGLAVLVSYSKRLPGFSLYIQDGFIHKWDVKNDFTFVLHFFSLISDCLGGVIFVQILDNYMSFFPKTIQMIRNNK